MPKSATRRLKKSVINNRRRNRINEFRIYILDILKNEQQSQQ